jgi:hypothetical protein
VNIKTDGVSDRHVQILVHNELMIVFQVLSELGTVISLPRVVIIGANGSDNLNEGFRCAVLITNTA